MLRLPGYWLNRKVGWPRLLPLSYTFSLTFKCNSRCATCNVWKMKPAGELKRGEWRKIFESVGRSPYWVTISGGEPFLRTDLIMVVTDLVNICRPKVVTVPTNGLLTEKIVHDVRRLAKLDTRLIINLSLDGVGPGHDQIRGVRGNFSKALKTYQRLKKIKSDRLTLGVHSVISKKNLKDFPQLVDYVLDEIKPASYVSEIAEERAELKTMNKKITPSSEEYRRAIGLLKSRAFPQSGLAKITAAFRQVYYDLVPEIMTQKTQVIDCFAGIASAQISPNGDVWPCCVRAGKLGNLKKVDFDFKKIWFSPKADKVRRSIKNKECFCPLANAAYTNILLSPSALGKVMVNLVKR